MVFIINVVRGYVGGGGGGGKGWGGGRGGGGGGGGREGGKQRSHVSWQHLTHQENGCKVVCDKCLELTPKHVIITTCCSGVAFLRGHEQMKVQGGGVLGRVAKEKGREGRKDYTHPK